MSCFGQQSLSVLDVTQWFIKKVDSTKYLGITFDSNLTWKSHINELCLKLSKTVGILSKVRHFVDNHVLAMLYYSLIYPFLTYGVHVWGLTFPSFPTQLFTIQKKAIRIISFNEPKPYSEPLFKSLIYQWSRRLLPPASVNISNLLDLFIPIQQGWIM